MPFCQNEQCKKIGLKRDEVEFDDELQMVLCRPCYQRRHPPIEVEVRHQGENIAPPVKEMLTAVADGEAGFGVHFTTDSGLQLEGRYGSIVAAVKVPMGEIKKIFDLD